MADPGPEIDSLTVRIAVDNRFVDNREVEDRRAMGEGGMAPNALRFPELLLRLWHMPAILLRHFADRLPSG